MTLCLQTGHDCRRPTFRKIGHGQKRSYLPQTPLLPAKSRTTNLGPFGEVIRASSSISPAIPIRWSTKYTDLETDMLYYEYRYYNPTTGRWLSRDPIGEKGGLNLYGFVGNAPADRFDRLGREIYPPPDINIMDNLVTCALDIENQVWDKFGWNKNDAGEWVPRPDHHEGDVNFHYGHCVASCRITRECTGGRCWAWTLGQLKEVWDEVQKRWKGIGAGYDMGDLDANHEGRVRARKYPKVSCEEACKGTEG